MFYIQKFLKLKIILSLAIIIPLLSSCASSIISGGVGAVIASGQDEKTTGEFVSDTAIRIAIKDRYFMNNIEVFADVGVDVELGKVLLTGIANNQEDRMSAVRLAWTVGGVNEVLNEIEIDEDYNILTLAEDKYIKAQLITKILIDKGIKNLKYNIEVKNHIIYLMGVTSSEEELKKVIDYAREIKKVKDIINYVQIRKEL